MRNIRKRFQDLLPQDPVRAGQVVSHNADGTSTVQLPAGGNVRVQGQGVAVGAQAFIQAGRVQGDAPDLPVYQIDI